MICAAYLRRAGYCFFSLPFFNPKNYKRIVIVFDKKLKYNS
ncbi:hypothetical protein T05_12163 [Trichinella murrelli]|uniref:Uncharacterized protein n=1 Tax=Trichinella murrelli TaxID=144512 RepID=A0A0V0SWN7_9BILA|nr:hypothetical protein T05_12163 [Trichinella murrelli]